MVRSVEPEVLMDAEHILQPCREVTEACLRSAFAKLLSRRVLLVGIILKPNTVRPGLICSHQESVDEVAAATVKCLLKVVPAAVARIAFLSAGQSGELASAHLNAMHVRSQLVPSPLPWALTFYLSVAPFSSRRWGFGAASKRTVARHSKPCGSARNAVTLPVQVGCKWN